MRGEDRRERRAHAGGGQRARVAVGQQRVAIGDQVGAETAHRAAGGGVLVGDGVRLASSRAGRSAVIGESVRSATAQQAIERPGEVDGGGTGRAQLRRDLVEQPALCGIIRRGRRSRAPSASP